MNDFCEYKAFFDEGLSFYKSAQIVQESSFRVENDEIDLFGPIVYLFRHSAELLFKSLIIKKLSISGIMDWQLVKLSSNKRKLSSTHSLLRITLTPIMMITRLLLGIAAFITTIAASLIGLLTSVFGLLALLQFFIGSWQNGIAFLVLTWLVSPIGLPAISNFLLNRLDRVCTFFEGLLC